MHPLQFSIQGCCLRGTTLSGSPDIEPEISEEGRLRSNFWAVLILLLGLALGTGCGGGSGSSGGGGTGTGGGAGGAVVPATPITLSAGQMVSGVDIAVATPASTPTPNAESIGLGTSATNAGTSVSQGQTATVILFGPGLSGNMQVSVTGPNDITISNPQTIMSTNNMPGISFTAAVAANAALGARTVILEDTKHDITTFTGGLEVVP